MVKRRQLTKAEERRVRKERIRRGKEKKRRFRQQQKIERKRRNKRNTQEFRGVSIMDVANNYKFYGKEVRTISYDKGDILYDRVMTYFDINDILNFWYYFTRDYDAKEVERVILTPRVNLEPVVLEQLYADGEKHCVIQPIKNWALLKAETSVANSTKYRYSSILSKLEVYEELYKDGIPENKLNEFADDIRVHIYIKDPIGKEYKSFKCVGRALRTFTYLNTRLNHAEHYISSNDDIKIYEDEMREVASNLGEGKGYYVGKSDCPNKIYLPDRIYTLTNDDNEVINKFWKKSIISNFSYEYLVDKKRSELWSRVSNYRAHCLFNDNLDTDNLREVDMPSAYLQYRECKFYNGFPSTVGPVYELNCNVNELKYEGGYYIRIISDENVDENVKKYLQAMGIISNYMYLTSIEIKMLSHFGYDMWALCGSFSYDTIDIEIPNELRVNKRYAKFVGKLNSINKYDIYKIKSTEKVFGEHLRTIYDNVYHNDHLNEIEISIPRKEVKAYNHIGSFFTAYCRVQTIMEMVKVPFEKCYGYKLDSFVYENSCEYTENKLFVPKTVKYDFKWGYRIFYSEDWRSMNGINLPTNKYQLVKGMGGTGKSHELLTLLPSAIYCCKAWPLLLDKRREFGCKVSTINKLLGISVSKDKKMENWVQENKMFPDTLIIDEITQIEPELLEEIIDKYNFSQIYFLGDIDEDGFNYQCKFVNDKVINFNKVMEGRDSFVREKVKNFRCKDDILMSRMLALRSVMKATNGNFVKVRNCFNKLFADRVLPVKYNYKRDWILGSTNEGNKEWDAKMKGEKYACQYHNLSHIKKGEALKGDISYDVKPNDRYAIQHAYTIHGFQGKTIRGGKLIIDCRGMFDYEQFYTAVSRVEYLDQIYILN